MAIRLALDTNRYIDFVRGHPQVLAWLEKAEAIWLPFIVIGELRAGFAHGSQGSYNESRLRHFLLQPGVDILFPDDQTTQHYAYLYRQLRQQGTPIPGKDLWIAALVVQHALMLCDRDRHFDHLPQIPRLQ